MENSKFSKISLIISGIALATSIVVLIISFSSKKGPETDSSKHSGNVSIDTTGKANIAYVNLDTILAEYDFSIKLQEDLLTQQKKAEANFNAKMAALEKKYKDFQEKARLGSFLSQSSMESQQQELMQEEANLQRYQQEATNELLMLQDSLNNVIFDSVVNFINEEYKDKYMLILGNIAGANIIYAADGLDITRDVVDQLNERYKKSK
ncbi:MAG: OmpH family outer membrane protein [Bacteroidales bacterium]|nr:OmpH family outer membrane protein [Bacteroidales bacterium]